MSINLKKRRTMKTQINYNEYLFSCLLKLHDHNFEQLEYDMQFNMIKAMYAAFEESTFNNPDKPVYECINTYLKSIYSPLTK